LSSREKDYGRGSFCSLGHWVNALFASLGSEASFQGEGGWLWKKRRKKAAALFRNEGISFHFASLVIF